MTIQPTHDSVAVISPVGRIDTTTSGILDDATRRTVDEGRDLLVDLSSTEYISSAGLRVFGARQAAAEPGRPAGPVRDGRTGSAGVSARRVHADLHRGTVQERGALAADADAGRDGEAARHRTCPVPATLSPEDRARLRRRHRTRLPQGTLTFGRSTEADVVINDGSMSRRHARIVAEQGASWSRPRRSQQHLRQR